MKGAAERHRHLRVAVPAQLENRRFEGGKRQRGCQAARGGGIVERFPLTDGSGYLGVVGGRRGLDYGRRLARLRWQRRFPGRHAVPLPPDARAAQAFGAADDWVVVSDETALPTPGPEVSAAPGRVVAATPLPPATPPVVHTLRELEDAADAVGRKAPAPADNAPAILFRPSDFPPLPAETVGDYVRRLATPPTPLVFSSEWSALVFEDSPGGDRADVTRRFPAGIRRLLDVGCGSGEAAATLCRERPGLAATGIERDPASAEHARRRPADVREGDAMTELSRLAAAGERFDALLFAERPRTLRRPIRSRLGRDNRFAGARSSRASRTLATFMVRDLVLGRFVPLAVGLADSGPPAFVPRSSLRCAEDAGWTDVTIEAEDSVPAPGAEEFLGWARAGPGSEVESLTTYQWIALARSASP